MYTRQYFVTLPTGYGPEQTLRAGLRGDGLRRHGQGRHPLNDGFPAVSPTSGNTVIRVGLTPPPNAIGHATRPGQGCYDYADGDNSVDWVFYETLHDHLATQLCFDTNRVFVVGNASGGAPFTNELGCKYAGDAKHPIRGIMANSGGFSPEVTAAMPTCSTSPMAGMWVAQIGDPSAPFTVVEAAIARAMKVNGCTLGTGFPKTRPPENFPIGGGNPDSTCKRILG